MTRWQQLPRYHPLRQILYVVLGCSVMLGAACKSSPSLHGLHKAIPAPPAVKTDSFETQMVSESTDSAAVAHETLTPAAPLATAYQGPPLNSDSTPGIATESEPPLTIIPSTATALSTPVKPTESVDRADPKSKPAGTLVIEGVRPDRGTVKVAIFTSASAFPNPGSASQSFELQPTNSKIETTLPTLGRFAVAVYQDINSDGQLNRTRLGVPTEPFAFSNNAIGQRGPPSFDQAAVVPPATAMPDDDEAPLIVTIKLP